jgi:hypothetical protein
MLLAFESRDIAVADIKMAWQAVPARPFTG